MKKNLSYNPKFMKTSNLITIAALAVLLLASCSQKQNTVEIPFNAVQSSITKSQVYGYIMSKEELASFAEEVPGLFDAPATKSGSRTVKEIIPITEASWMEGVEALDDISDELMHNTYVVNYENDEGFSIICADNRVEQVIAFAEYGNLMMMSDSLDIPGGGGGGGNGGGGSEGEYTIQDIAGLFPYYVSELGQYVFPYPTFCVDSLNADGWYFAHPNYYYSDVIITDSKMVSTGTTWGQNSPYNTYCNNGAYDTGYGTIAIAALMKYHGYPTSFTSEGNTYYISWSSLPSVITSSNWNSNTDALARLIKEIGSRGATDWPEAYLQNESNIKTILNYYGYACPSAQYYSYDSLKESLDNNCPVIIVGKTGNSSNVRYRAWLAEGYRHQARKRLCDWDVYNPNGEYCGRWTSVDNNSMMNESRYVYCNWGSGSSNMYVLSYCFNDGSNSYNNSVKIFTNIH